MKIAVLLQKNLIHYMIKIGVFGIGKNTESNLQILRSLNEFEITGIFDHDPNKAMELASQFHLKSFNSPKLLLDKCDAVCLNSPTKQYYDLAIEAIRNFKHIFIEQPTLLGESETLSILKLANEGNMKVQVNYPERFNPAYSTGRGYVNNPMFVESHRLAVFNEDTADQPVVFDLMVHDIDIVLSTIKSNVKKISSSGVSIVSDTFDIANARIEFDNGCVANITASRLSLYPMSKSRFFQKDAYITLDFFNKEVNVLRIKDTDFMNQLPNSKIIGEREVYLEKPEVVNHKVIFREEMQNFHHSIIHDTKPLTSIEDSYNTLTVANKIIERMKLTSNCM